MGNLLYSTILIYVFLLAQHSAALAQEVNGSVVSSTEIVYSETLVDQAALRQEQINSLTEFNPELYWSYSDFEITWDENCTVSVKIVVRLPRIIGSDEIEDLAIEQGVNLQQAAMRYETFFTTMIRMFAGEIARSGCPADNSRIAQDWNTTMISFRLNSFGGRLFGVEWIPSSN